MDNMKEQEDPNEENYLTNLSKGISDGVNDDMDKVKDFIMQMFGGKDRMMNGNPDMSPTLPGLQNLADQKAEAVNTPLTQNQGYADGGIVEDDGSDFLNKLQNGTAGVDAPATPITFDPKSGLPPAPPHPVSAPLAQTAIPNAGLGDYVNQQKAQINKFGPDQQQAVTQQILQQQNGLGGRLANAGTGLADALMQGVARAGNPGFQQNLQNRQNAQGQLQLDSLKNEREGNLQNVEAGQKLDAIDPNSQLSASKRAQNGPILAAMGFSPDVVGKMSAAEMDTTLQILKDFRGKDLETAVARYKAQIEANQLAEETRSHKVNEAQKGTELAQQAKHQTAEEGEKEQEIGTGKLEKAATEPLTSRLAGLVGLNPAGKVLQDQAVGAHPDDAVAIQWAQAHPNDPRAAKIKALHGIQ